MPSYHHVCQVIFVVLSVLLLSYQWKPNKGTFLNLKDVKQKTYQHEIFHHNHHNVLRMLGHNNWNRKFDHFYYQMAYQRVRFYTYYIRNNPRANVCLYMTSPEFYHYYYHH